MEAEDGDEAHVIFGDLCAAALAPVEPFGGTGPGSRIPLAIMSP